MGEIIALISTLGFASANVLARKAALKSSASISLYGSLFSTIITLVLSVIVYVVLWVVRQKIIINVEGIMWFVAAGFLSVYVGRTFLYYSLEHLDSVSASNVKSLAPFFTVIIAAIFLGEPITIPVWIGGTLIFASLFLISNHKKKATAVHGSVKRSIYSAGNIGLFYGILSALGYALGNSIRKIGMNVLPDPYLGAIAGSVIGILIFLVFAMFNGNYRNAFTSIVRTTNSSVFYSGLALSFGQILFLVSLLYTGVARATLIVSAQTIVTVLISKWIFKTNEKIGVYQIVSIFCAMVGVVLIILV